MFLKDIFYLAEFIEFANLIKHNEVWILLNMKN